METAKIFELILIVRLFEFEISAFANIRKKDDDNSYLLCPYNPTGISLSLINSKYSCHAKIRDGRIHISIQQYVARFKITMYNSKPRIFMEILNSSSNASNNLVSSSPIQQPLFFRNYNVKIDSIHKKNLKSK